MFLLWIRWELNKFIFWLQSVLVTLIIAVLFPYLLIEKAAIIIGWSGIILYSTSIAVVIPCLIYLSFISSDNYGVFDGLKGETGWLIFIISASALVIILNLCTSVLLLAGVKKRKSKCLKRWLAANSSIFGYSIMSIITGDYYLIPVALFSKITI